MACPLDPAWIALQFQSVLSSLAVLEPHNSSIFLDKHQTGTRFNLLTTETTDSSLWQNLTSR